MKRALSAMSRQNMQSVVHMTALYGGPPAAGAGAWALYWASGWGPDGAGGDLRGAVLGFVGASLVVAAVLGAMFGDVVDADFESSLPEHPLRYLLGYAAVFSGYLLLVLALVLLPLALILSI
ncbi:hypothetical protein [Catenulispora pinisilvae]|uniref:hypothetical protein n=1 Tax=Catenulispora pinisilvae TaxID=2705253 RepID=UPI0018910A2B|nr:hypothetical protein [Catenulispora pinisilvae]